MDWQPTVYSAPLAVAAIVSAGLFVLVLRTRSRRGASSMAALLLGIVLWAGFEAMKLSMATVRYKLLFHNLSALGMALIGIPVLAFAAEYTNRSRLLTPRNVTLLFVVPAVAYGFLWTSMPGWICDCHDLVIAGVSTRTLPGGVERLSLRYGPMATLFVVYSYGLMAVAIYFLVSEHRQKRSAELYRGQIWLFAAGIAVPWVLSIARETGLTPVDYTPMGFLATGLAFAVAFFRFRLLDIVPIARGEAVETMKDGVIIVDDEERIVDLNPTAESVFGLSEDEALGCRMHTIYEAYDELIAEEAVDGQQITVDRNGEQRHYDVRISTIYDPNDCLTGRTLLLDDITEQVRRQRRLEQQKRELEAQNERLEEFASIVSHDLRNPINVIEGYTETVRATGDLEHLGEIEQSTDRMKEIIEDVLAMARTGKSVTDPEKIELARLCEDAWATVDTPGGTLELGTKATVVGDRQRLQRLFENLFRNAIDHGTGEGEDADDSITVRVLDIEGGFAVEDDGPGIPEEERDDVLDRGYTTAADGTGFGLSIVTACAEAHGWLVAVTEGIDGGARFEFADVSRTIPSDPIGDSDADRVAPSASN